MNRAFVLTVAVATCGASASGAFFGFESEVVSTLPDGTRPGAYTSLLMSDGGVDVTVSRVGGGAFDIFDNDTFVGGGPEFRPPATWDQKSLDPFFDEDGSDGVGFIFEFTQLVENFQIDFGDFGGDDDSITVELYTDATLTTLVNSDSGSLPGNTTSAFVASGISISGQFRVAVVYGGSSAFPHSVFYDNIGVDLVPAPATVGVMGLSLIGAARRRR